MVSGATPEELADRALAAGLIPEGAYDRIVSSALYAMARFVGRGYPLDRCEFHLAPDPGDPGSVNILYAERIQRDPAKLARLLGDGDPEAILRAARARREGPTDAGEWCDE